MLTFYFAPGSSSMAPHIALHEVGATFESRPLSFAKAEQKAPEYLAVNPQGTVPALVIDGQPLTEVAAILFYLARRFPAADLLPRDDVAREAQAVSWMSFVASTLHGAWIARRTNIERTRAAYALAEQRLGERAWALGDRYSIADIHLFRLYWRYRGMLGADPSELPNLARHHARMMERPAVQRTIAIEEAIGYELT